MPVFGQPSVGSIGGMAIQSVSSMQADQAANDSALADQQATPLIQNLAGHIKSFFLQAEATKLDVQNKMLEAMYARRGEYTPEKSAKIVADGKATKVWTADELKAIKLKTPVLDNEELARIRYMDLPGFRSITLPMALTATSSATW